MSITNDITKGLLARIRSRWKHEAFAFRVNVTKSHTYVKSVPDGTPDILSVIKGFAVAIEVKGPGDTQRQSQIAWQREWIAAGGLYFICTECTEEFLDIVAMAVEACLYDHP